MRSSRSTSFRHLLRGREPPLRISTGPAVDPMASLVARCRVDDAGNVPARGQGEAHRALYQGGRAIGRLPGEDMILAARQHIGGILDLAEIDGDVALDCLSGDGDVVREVRVAHVPA